MNVMSRVKMNKEGIFIDGKATIILCGSLFYYRIPSELWEDRMIKIKRAGYNCIDVYFPWNFHEYVEGEWDFSGDRNVERFLMLAKKHGLYVVARPGPYICGEWDGGGLPAYLYTKKLNVRQYDEKFLSYVEEWYKRIIPIIAKHQIDNGGTVITLQVENELDFYKCKEPNRYISALRDMARRYGITVPIFACAGQFDIERATGYAEQVIPTINVYPDLHTPKLEERTIKFYRYMTELDYPLMVTETNRSHQLLRRLLLNGTKLLGPFNQVGGTCFGFTNAINNWGRPLTFLASDYNFGGFINGQGEVSQEFYQARLLANYINLFGEKLGRATVENKPIQFIGKTDVTSYPYVLKLYQGGSIATVTNYQNEVEYVRIEVDGKIYPKNVDIQLERLNAPFILLDLPLDFLGLNAIVKFSSLEFAKHFKLNNQHVLITYTNSVGEIQLQLDHATLHSISCDGHYELENEHIIINLHPNETCVLTTDEFTLKIITLTEKEAALVHQVTEDGLIYIKDEHVRSSRYLKPLTLYASELPNEAFLTPNVIETSIIQPIEKYGFYRGYATYQFTFSNEERIKGILVHEVSDVCSIFLNEKYLGTAITGNNHYFIPVDQQNLTQHNRLNIRTEIWGHTNFHDESLPSLHIDALKGLTGVSLIHTITTLEAKSFNDNTYRIVLKLNAIDSNNRYFIKLPISWYSDLIVNGQVIGRYHHLHQIADVTAHLNVGENTIDVVTHHPLTDDPFQLMKGKPINLLKVNFVEEKDLIDLVKQKTLDTQLAQLPIKVKPGTMRVVTIDFNGLGPRSAYLILNGRNLKLTAIYNNQITSRVWLHSQNGPQMTGGNPAMIYLPYRKARETDRCYLLIEGIHQEEDTVLTDLSVYVIPHEYRENE